MIYDFHALVDLIHLAAEDEEHGAALPDLNLMVAIAFRESGGNPLAANATNRNGTVDRGLWQINSAHESEFPELGDFRTACYTPILNARMAIAIWRRQGYQAWSSFKALP